MSREDTVLLDVSDYLARGFPKIFVQSLCTCYWDLGNFQTDKFFLTIKETPNIYRRGAKACHEKTARWIMWTLHKVPLVSICVSRTTLMKQFVSYSSNMQDFNQVPISSQSA